MKVPDIQTEFPFHLASFIQPDIVLLYDFLLDIWLWKEQFK